VPLHCHLKEKEKEKEKENKIPIKSENKKLSMSKASHNTHHLLSLFSYTEPLKYH